MCVYCEVVDFVENNNLFFVPRLEWKNSVRLVIQNNKWYLWRSYVVCENGLMVRRTNAMLPIDSCPICGRELK